MASKKLAFRGARLAAYHEAGHAVAAHACGFQVEWAEVEKDEEGLKGSTHFRLDLALGVSDQEILIRQVIVGHAGPASEARAMKRSFADVMRGHGFHDWLQVYDVAKHLYRSDSERFRLLRCATQEARSLISLNWEGAIANFW